MHLMKAELSYYECTKALETMTEERWESARAAAPGLDLPPWDIVNPAREWGQGEYGKHWSVEGVITTHELRAVSALGLTVKVSRVRGIFSEATPGAVLEGANHAQTVNIDISVPGGVALMSVRQVSWLEDCCTEHLQRQLEAGWRIVAVCPPNDTRRPTYIIGHQEPGARVQ